MKLIIQVLFILVLLSPIHSLAYDCAFIQKEMEAKHQDDELIRKEIVELKSKIAVVMDANRQIEEYKNKQRDYFQSNIIKMTAYLGYQTYKEIKPIFGANSFKSIFNWTRSKVGVYVTFESASIGGYTPNAQSLQDQFGAEYEKQLWGKGYYTVHIKPIQTSAKSFVEAVNELKKFENYTLDAYRAYAHKTTDYGKDGKVTDTKDTTMVLVRGKTLVEKCEVAQEALLNLRYELPKTIEQFEQDRRRIKNELEALNKNLTECLKFSPKEVLESEPEKLKDIIENTEVTQLGMIQIDDHNCDGPCAALKSECQQIQAEIDTVDESIEKVFKDVDKKIFNIVDEYTVRSQDIKAELIPIQKRFIEIRKAISAETIIDQSIENIKVLQRESTALINYYIEVLSIEDTALYDYDEKIKELNNKIKALSDNVLEARGLVSYSNYCRSCSNKYIFKYDMTPCGYYCNSCSENPIGQRLSPGAISEAVKKRIAEYNKFSYQRSHKIRQSKSEIKKNRELVEGFGEMIKDRQKVKSLLLNQKSQCKSLVQSYNEVKRERCATYEKIDDLYYYLVEHGVIHVDSKGFGVVDKWIVDNDVEEATSKTRKWYFMLDDYNYELDKLHEKKAIYLEAVSRCLSERIDLGAGNSFGISSVTKDEFDIHQYDYCPRGSYGEPKYGLDWGLSMFFIKLPEYIKSKKISFENEEIDAKYQKLYDEQNEYNRAKYTQDLQERLKFIKEMELLQVETKAESEKREKIKSFYQNFKELYESKDVSSLSSQLSGDWSSSEDDVSIDDLEEYLGSSFDMFDDVSYEISGIYMEKLGENRYAVSYNVEIRGEIYDNEIEHIEKSTVNEELIIKNNRVQIDKTLSGRFWMIK